MANINIYGELYNDTPNGYVAPATQIKDVDLGKTQDQINAELAASGSASEANTGYVTCGTAAATAAKEINDITTLAGFVLDQNIRLLVKMTNNNTAASPTLNINGTGAKTITYNGAAASANNSWAAGEVLDVYYDGSTNFVANTHGGAQFNTGEKVGDVGIGDVPGTNVKSVMSQKGVTDLVSEYNVSANNNNAEYTFAQAVALVPASLQKGGLTIKYIDSTTHEYAVRRLVSSTWNTTESNWQGIDDEPTAGSDNLVKSGGVYGAIYLNAFKFEGKGSDIISTKVQFVKGRKYSITFKGDWQCTSATSVTKLQITPSAGTSILTVASSQTVANNYIVTAADADYHTVHIRADIGEVVYMRIEDVTDCYVKHITATISFSKTASGYDVSISSLLIKTQTNYLNKTNLSVSVTSNCWIVYRPSSDSLEIVNGTTVTEEDIVLLVYAEGTFVGGVLFGYFINSFVRRCPVVIAATGFDYSGTTLSWTGISIKLPDGTVYDGSNGSFTMTASLPLLLYRPSSNAIIQRGSFASVEKEDILLAYYREPYGIVEGELAYYIKEKKYPSFVVATGAKITDTTVSWTSLQIKAADGSVINIGSGEYDLKNNPILVYRPSSNSVQRLGTLASINDKDLLLAYYRAGYGISAGELVNYIQNRDNHPIVVYGTDINWDGNNVSWSSLSIRYFDGRTIELSSASYRLSGSLPLLVYSFADGIIKNYGSMSNIATNDILLAYFRNRYIVDGVLLPYFNSQKIYNERYNSALKNNIARRGEQLSDVKWTAKADFDSGEGMHYAGTECSGVPYSSVKEKMKYVGIDVSLHTFMTAINDIHSLQYTENPLGSNSQSAYGITYHGVNCKCYYGTVCSGFVITSLGYKIQDNSWEFKTIKDKYDVLPNQDADCLEIGDVLSQNGHCSIVSNIRKAPNGAIDRIYVSEQVAASVDAPIITSSYTKKEAEDKAFRQQALWCRSKDLSINVGYKPSSFVLLDNEYLYVVGDCVFVDDYTSRDFYVCKTDNSDSTFTASKWNKVNVWSANTQYTAGTYIQVGENLYRAKVNNDDSSFQASNWQKIPCVEWAAYPYVYNDDIDTFAGDRAAFRTNDLIYINYNKGDYTKMQIFKDGTLVQTLNLPNDDSYQLDVSQYCSTYGMYKACLIDDNGGYSRFTYFEVIDATVSVTYSNNIATVEFSSANGTPIGVDVTELSGYPMFHKEFVSTEVEKGEIVINPEAGLYSYRYIYPGRYEGVNTAAYIRVIFVGEYGNVVNDMISIGNIAYTEGLLAYPSKNVDFGTISGTKEIILADRLLDNSFVFSFEAGENCSVSIVPTVGTLKWINPVGSFIEGKTYLFRIENGIANYTEI